MYISISYSNIQTLTLVSLNDHFMGQDTHSWPCCLSVRRTQDGCVRRNVMLICYHLHNAPLKNCARSGTGRGSAGTPAAVPGRTDGTRPARLTAACFTRSTFVWSQMSGLDDWSVRLLFLWNPVRPVLVLSGGIVSSQVNTSLHKTLIKFINLGFHYSHSF